MSPLDGVAWDAHELPPRIRHERTAGVGSALPAASRARTRNTWRPTLNRLYVRGERHAVHRPRSSLHWNLEPASVDANPNLARCSLVRRDGAAVNRVFGGVVSRVWVRAGGAGGDGGGAGGGLGGCG
jgi:hypothetical protein